MWTKSIEGVWRSKGGRIVRDIEVIGRIGGGPWSHW